MGKRLAAVAAVLATCAGTAHARPVVAVIDSGVAMTPELAPVLMGEYDTAAAKARTAFRPRYDHGTMVATILSRAAGGRVGIVSFRIDDPAGCPDGLTPPCQGSAAPIARAIRQATRMGVDAINISLTLQDDPEITAAVREAAKRGITVVLAAGNEGRAAPGNLKPAIAGWPHTVLVGALDAGGRVWKGSNRPEAHPSARYSYVWRRGVGVSASAIDGSAVWGTGTSFAAPIEAGLRAGAAERVSSGGLVASR